MSNIITATRRLQFCSGHRVYQHGSKCRHMHGHNYVALLTAQATDLDALGMVIDFSVLKEKIGSWIDAYWDHGFIVYEKDEAAKKALELFQEADSRPEAGRPGFMQKVFEMPYNPTAENMAKYLLELANHRLLPPSPVRLVEVTVWETENCYATARVDDVAATLTLLVE